LRKTREREKEDRLKVLENRDTEMLQSSLLFPLLVRGEGKQEGKGGEVKRRKRGIGISCIFFVSRLGSEGEKAPTIPEDQFVGTAIGKGLQIERKEGSGKNPWTEKSVSLSAKRKTKTPERELGEWKLQVMGKEERSKVWEHKARGDNFHKE